MDIEGEELLVKLSKARRERLKQLILAAYRKIYPIQVKQVRQGTPLLPAKLDFIIQNKTHLEMQYITNIYAIINNFMNYVCTKPIYDANYLPDLFNNLINTTINELLGESNYKYGIYGSNAWYNLFGDTAPALSDYELSAINKYNTKEYIFIIRNTDDENLKLLQMHTINALKKIADYLNIHVQNALEEIKRINPDEFSYFNGKEVFVGLKHYSDIKLLFQNAFTFSITLFITKSDAIIPENEIIVDREFINIEEYNNFIDTSKILKDNIKKRRNGEYNLPQYSFQLASYIGKYKQMGLDQSQLISLPVSKPTRRKRKTREEEEAEEEEEKCARALNKQAQKAGRAARAELRAIAKADGSSGRTGGRMKLKKKNEKNKKKKGGVCKNDDSNYFLKFKLFTFSFNIFSKEINDEEKENETLLFNNFDKLLAIKEDDKNEQYFGLEGLYILNKIMQQKIFIQRDRYNPYKIRNFIFEKFIFRLYEDQSKQKFEKMWYISDIFEKTFERLNIVKEFINDKMKRDILELHEELNEFKETIESNVIKILRPYINKTILTINDELNEMKFKMNDIIKPKSRKIEKPEPQTGIFILGGDAMRRYKYDASKTKDIDAKIYMPITISFGNDDQIKIFRCITSNLIKLLVYLENNKKTLFQSLLATSHKEIGENDNKITIDIDFIDNDPENVNFKFRKTGKPNFPTDLYSIDYKCIFKVNYMTKTILIPVEIAFIDIVFKQEGQRYYNNLSVFAENKLPLAKLEFLLSDLLNTYNENDLSLLRFFAGKSDKDYDRLNTLWDIYFKQKSALPLYSIDSNNTIHFISDENKQTNEELNNIIDYSITADDHLYNSIMTTLDNLISKNRITIINEFKDYKQSKSRNSTAKKGGLSNYYNLKSQSPLKSLSQLPLKSQFQLPLKSLSQLPLKSQFQLPLKSQSQSALILNDDFRYTQHNITNDLIKLMSLSNDNFKKEITNINDTSLIEIIKIFNNNYYDEFVKILKPEVSFENDDPSIFKSTKLTNNIIRMDNNINIFFKK